MKLQQRHRTAKAQAFQPHDARGPRSTGRSSSSSAAAARPGRHLPAGAAPKTPPGEVAPQRQHRGTCSNVHEPYKALRTRKDRIHSREIKNCDVAVILSTKVVGTGTQARGTTNETASIASPPDLCRRTDRYMDARQGQTRQPLGRATRNTRHTARRVRSVIEGGGFAFLPPRLQHNHAVPRFLPELSDF